MNPLAGKPAQHDMLVDIPKLITSYYSETPDASIREQSVAFGTSGHRGTSIKKSFNELHILAITQAICLYRKQQNINGPLFLGFDTHALSFPAFVSALEVLAANGVEVMIAEANEYTPTPVISHAILTYNQGKTDGLSDGIVISPSHNPPQDGGFKYNPTNGGPADTNITKWVENQANDFLKNGMKGVSRIPYERALKTSTTHHYNFLTPYISDLKNVINLDLIRDSKISIGVDPLGGAGVHYWGKIAEHYKLNLTVVNKVVDPAFGFMTFDWDGQIRMDPSSSFAMQKLIAMKDKFDVSVASDPDHDRHGIVAKSVGLLPPNHYLSVAIFYLLQNRPDWSKTAAIGKTVVSSLMIDRVTQKLGRKLYEVPVGFKWFVDGLVDSSICFGGEESAGASFSRFDGKVWTTDKDGIIPGLLSAEITAKMGKDPGEIYKSLTSDLGEPLFERIDAPATPDQKANLAKLSAAQVHAKTLAGENILNILTTAPGNNAAIGGLKVVTENGWFAARPSGTENIYKIYAESFKGRDHLKNIFEEAQSIVNASL